MNSPQLCLTGRVSVEALSDRRPRGLDLRRRQLGARILARVFRELHRFCARWRVARPPSAASVDLDHLIEPGQVEPRADSCCAQAFEQCPIAPQLCLVASGFLGKKSV